LLGVIENLLNRVELDIEARGAVMTAIQWYQTGTADFADYLIAALNQEAGATTTYTFDERAASSSAFELIS
jgi:predicted nucleic-acid-binding protein